MVVEKKKAAPAKAKAEKVEKKPAAEKIETVAVSVSGDSRNALQKRRIVEGLVVSDKMQKTIVVKVDRRVRDTMYKKYVVRSRRFKAHDEKNEAKIGDLVTIVESRPLSKEKRWVLNSILRRAGQVAEINV
ncbi:MAG TPA: 30S ribosomal protein S17 [Bdellovibrionales bacterium]|nr:30S ribosomal protein S17 [Bdellovibrionales bacterium]HCM41463.1 30S ribosomal protein S17 [Bdellovibrionales bacterium]